MLEHAQKLGHRKVKVKAAGARYSQTGEDHVVNDELEHLLQELRDEMLAVGQHSPPAAVIMPHLVTLFTKNNEQCDYSSY